MPTIPTASTIQNRTFGIELEVFGLNTVAAARALRDAGIDAYDEDYNHTARSYWKVVTDGSICDMRGNEARGNSCEVVSPILRGEEGLEQVKLVCRALAAAGAKVNKSTGFHVHVNARDLSAHEIATTIVRYSRTENVIDSFMPISRRANNNHFCSSMINQVDYYMNALLRAASSANVRDITTALSNRYLKLNVQSYLRHGTIEFRQHSGTINAEKCVNWIRFCVNFVEVSRAYARGTMTETPATPARRRGRPARDGRNNGPASQRLVALLASEARYFSVSEIASSLGISEASVPATVSAARSGQLNSATQRIKNSRRYGYCFVTTEASEHVCLTNTTFRAALQPRTPNQAFNGFSFPADDSCFLGLTDSVISYYQERISELSA